MDAPDSYDHDKLLSICDIHLACRGNRQFVELRCRAVPLTSGVDMNVDQQAGTTCSATEFSPNAPCPATVSTAGSGTVSITIGTIKSDLDTLNELLLMESHEDMSTDNQTGGLIKYSTVKPSVV